MDKVSEAVRGKKIYKRRRRVLLHASVEELRSVLKQCSKLPVVSGKYLREIYVVLIVGQKGFVKIPCQCSRYTSHTHWREALLCPVGAALLLLTAELIRKKWRKQ